MQKATQSLSTRKFLKFQNISENLKIKFKIALPEKSVTKHTQLLTELDWFLCEDARYLGDALTKNPCGFILTREEYAKSINTYPALRRYPKIFVQDPYEEWAKMCAFAFPKRPDFIFGVTGTNGKTTVAYTCYKLWQKLGLKAGYIGTNGIFPKIPDIDTNLTTPDAYDLYAVLDKFKTIGINHVAIEISSSGLDRKRASQLRLNLGAFTSFSQDHLDIHHTMDNYWQSKMQILDLVDGHFLVSAEVGKLILEKENIDYVVYNNDMIYKKENFIGFMNDNLQCAGKVCELMGFSSEEIQSALDSTELVVPGRMQVVSNSPKVIVDYAHTPDGLEKVLRLFPKEKIIVVFGCGGERDKTKRKLMGEVAKKFAKIVVVTDDNPRGESPEEIRREIMNGCPDAIEIGAREMAIKYAIDQAKSHDYVCLLCGKGAETKQIYADHQLDFSDLRIAEKICVSYIYN